MRTKDKIIDASVELFNQRGISNTTLRDIADVVGISIGNLAYHYKNKDFIITDIFRKMENERAAKLADVQQFPSFENANEQALEIIHISIKYRFFFLDTLDIIRDYPTLGSAHQKFIDEQIKYVRAMLSHSEQKANLKPEPRKGYYDQLSEIIWMTMQFWLANEAIRGKKYHDPYAARNAMWALIEPHLTEKGQNIFAVKELKKELKTEVKNQ